MLRLIAFVMAVVLFSPPFNSARGDFAKYKALEAYEIRPGILMMPTYSADGHVCKIGLEDLHYSPELIRLDFNLSETVIHQIFDELVPENERGPRTALDGLIRGSGHDVTETTDFERVSLQIYSDAPSKSKRWPSVDNNIAVINWKTRGCQKQ
ncbi:MAG: hypothetical protein WAM91_16305 [Candidatus Acidiferrales bacterium]